jgi:hypothetical protein
VVCDVVCDVDSGRDRRFFSMKRLPLVSAIFVVSLVVLVVALPAGASPVRTPRSFTLSSQTCPNLPTGTTLNGSGIESSITIEDQREWRHDDHKRNAHARDHHRPRWQRVRV